MKSDVLKFSKEADLAIKNGRVIINGLIVREDMEIEFTGEYKPESDFWYDWFKNHNEEYTQNELFMLTFLYLPNIQWLFDTTEKWNEDIYIKYKSIIDHCSKYISLWVGKKKFILTKSI